MYPLLESASMFFWQKFGFSSCLSILKWCVQVLFIKWPQLYSTPLHTLSKSGILFFFQFHQWFGSLTSLWVLQRAPPSPSTAIPRHSPEPSATGYMKMWCCCLQGSTWPISVRTVLRYTCDSPSTTYRPKTLETTAASPRTPLGRLRDLYDYMVRKRALFDTWESYVRISKNAGFWYGVQPGFVWLKVFRANPRKRHFFTEENWGILCSGVGIRKHASCLNLRSWFQTFRCHRRAQQLMKWKVADQQ